MQRLSKMIFAVALGCVAAATGFAQGLEQTTTARDRQSVNITVYNSNLGLVRETRRLTLPAGRIGLRFADVTAQIRPETVHLASLTAPANLRILEQNYQYDLLNPAKLLDKFVGREITPCCAAIRTTPRVLNRCRQLCFRTMVVRFGINGRS